MKERKMIPSTNYVSCTNIDTIEDLELLGFEIFIILRWVETDDLSNLLGKEIHK